MSSDRYQLIDFGNGRKLESLAGRLVDRPSPAASQVAPRSAKRWGEALSRYDAEQKMWSHVDPWPESLSVDCGGFRMPVRPTPFGHIGLFPEQAENWAWLQNVHGPVSDQCSALNLFGYTGASTMALVVAGYRVAHVDAAKQNVQALREAAELNGHRKAPIRFLIDDAVKFARREVRRNRRYDTIVLDPPAYGHAPTGKAWRLERDLWPLLDHCLQLIDPGDFRLLITGHSPEIDQSDVCQYFQQSDILRPPGGRSGLRIESGRSQLKDVSGRALDAGFFVRAHARP